MSKPVKEAMNSTIIERAVAKHFGYREHVIVANVNWGLGMHECDLLLLTSTGYGIEVEIKVSRSDIIADKKKPHHRQHKEDRIKRLYFAIPEKLNVASVLVHIPEHAGIIVVKKDYREWDKSTRYHCEVVRKGTPNPHARQWFPGEKFDMARLGAMRYWYRHVGPVDTPPFTVSDMHEPHSVAPGANVLDQQEAA